jgi:hypothetical protein
MKRSALKGRKLTWINPTHIAPQNEFRVCLAVLETHLENKGERLRDISPLHYIHMLFQCSNLAPFQGASPRVAGSRG